MFVLTKIPVFFMPNGKNPHFFLRRIFDAFEVINSSKIVIKWSTFCPRCNIFLPSVTHPTNRSISQNSNWYQLDEANLDTIWCFVLLFSQN